MINLKFEKKIEITLCFVAFIYSYFLYIRKIRKKNITKMKGLILFYILFSKNIYIIIKKLIK